MNLWTRPICLLTQLNNPVIIINCYSILLIPIPLPSFTGRGNKVPYVSTSLLANSLANSESTLAHIYAPAQENCNTKTPTHYSFFFCLFCSPRVTRLSCWRPFYTVFRSWSMPWSVPASHHQEEPPPHGSGSYAFRDRRTYLISLFLLQKPPNPRFWDLPREVVS